jgi:purine-binding chemotaxis protein CheW
MNNECLKHLVFSLCDENYAVSTNLIREIVIMTEISQVPKAPPFIKGVINLRGKIIPVVDLRIKFGLSEKAYDNRTCVIIIEIKEEDRNRLVGVIVDSVDDVVSITNEDISAMPNFNNDYQIVFLKGMLKIKEKITWIINLDKIISNDELVILNKFEEDK